MQIQALYVHYYFNGVVRVCVFGVVWSDRRPANPLPSPFQCWFSVAVAAATLSSVWTSERRVANTDRRARSGYWVNGKRETRQRQCSGLQINEILYIQFSIIVMGGSMKRTFVAERLLLGRQTERCGGVVRRVRKRRASMCCERPATRECPTKKNHTPAERAQPGVQMCAGGRMRRTRRVADQSEAAESFDLLLLLLLVCVAVRVHVAMGVRRRQQRLRLIDVVGHHPHLQLATLQRVAHQAGNDDIVSQG